VLSNASLVADYTDRDHVFVLRGVLIFSDLLATDDTNLHGCIAHGFMLF
jgi:hypothetical protein